MSHLTSVNKLAIVKSNKTLLAKGNPAMYDYIDHNLLYLSEHCYEYICPACETATIIEMSHFEECDNPDCDGTLTTNASKAVADILNSSHVDDDKTTVLTAAVRTEYPLLELYGSGDKPNGPWVYFSSNLNELVGVELRLTVAGWECIEVFPHTNRDF